jgi:hypothetical protein
LVLPAAPYESDPQRWPHLDWKLSARPPATLRELREWIDQTAYTYEHRSSDAAGHAARLRSTGMSLVCWIHDSPPEGVNVVALWQRFFDGVELAR